MRNPVPVLLVLTLLVGCTPLHERIMRPEPQNASSRQMEHALTTHMGIRSVRFDVEGARQLRYLSLEPGSYGLEVDYQSRGSNGFTFGITTGEPRPAGAPRGTLILLHGWSMDAVSMVPWMIGFAEHGLRSVALDLRGHGASDPAPVGYGPREADDVLALLEHLRKHGALQEPVYLMGVSYGAATAAFASERLRQGIAGIILVVPYGNAADGIASGVAGLLAAPASGVGQRMSRPFQRARYEEARVRQAIERASSELGIALDDVSVREALETTETCTLLLHGALDRLIPTSVGQELASGLTHVQRVTFPDDGHLSLPLRLDWLLQPLAAWMDALGGEACPLLELPPDPAS